MALVLGTGLPSGSRQGGIPQEGGEAMSSPGEIADRVEPLPAPDRKGTRPLETLLQARLSVREFKRDTLAARELGQLLWAACGVTQTTDWAHRTVPSAGALYPLELYLLTSRGIAHYDPFEHSLRWFKVGDQRPALAKAALRQSCVREAPAVFIIAAAPDRTTRKYGERGLHYVDMETGLVCQNLLLEATALGLGGVPVGAFHDDDVAAVLGLPAGQVPRLIVPIGRPR
jgi:SagB-type dehydrogenase family enzyme